ncbi:MAG: hypothetical protein KA297_20505 [Kofleriaceae bacterium]|mgnify:CR=1 FL=1|nr:hypothetical protein [Kofleriaceae bacterium]MBP6837558.1 hypothetical protein [Kofleriaceae bacterium]
MAGDAPDRPDRPRRHLLVAAAACVGFCLGLTLCDYGGWPRVIYQPYQHTWSIGAEPPPGVAMLFFGTLLWALAAAVLAAMVTAVCLRGWRRPIASRVVWLATAWAGTALLLAAGYFLWSLFPF